MKILLKNFISTLRHYKTASLLNVLGLSIAFAAFMVIRTQVKYDLQYNRNIPDSERIYRIEGSFRGQTGYGPWTSEKILNLCAGIPGVELAGLAGSPSETYWTTDPESGEYPFKYMKAQLQPELITLFGFRFTEGDTANYKSNRKIVIPESMATRLFPEESAVGKTIRHDQNKNFFEIVAVYEDFPENCMVINCMYEFFKPSNKGSIGNWTHTGYLKISPHADPEQIEQSLMELIKSEVGNDHYFLRISPLNELHFLSDVLHDEVPKANKTVVQTISLVAWLIIVIAIINFVNFSVSLAPGRMRNINTQKILGASTLSIRLNLIGEAVGILSISFLLSIAITYLVSVSGFRTLLSVDVSPWNNPEIVGFTFLIALASGAAAGIYPAFYLTSCNLAAAIKGSFGHSPSGKKIRIALISFQYVISFTLIICALYLHKQNNYMRNFPIGIDKELVVEVRERSKTLDQNRKKIEDALRSNPRIKDLAFTHGGIISDGKMGWGYEYKGKHAVMDFQPFAGQIIGTLGLTILEGRDFMESDSLKQHMTVIVNESAMKAYDFDLNQVFHYNMGPIEVIGVVNDFNYQPLSRSISPFMFLNTLDYWSPDHIYIKIENQRTAETMDFIRSTLMEFNQIESDLHIGFLDQAIGSLYENERKTSALITVFCLMTLMISLMGVFGLILFEANMRRKEIGIRKINGATIGQVLLMFNKTFLVLTTLCFALSIPPSVYFILEWKSGFTYQAPINIWIFLAAYAIIMVITALTVTSQSYRTAAENPVNSLRTE